MSASRRPIYVNRSACSWVPGSELRAGLSDSIAQFTGSLPGFEQTNLIALPTIANEVGAKQVFVKDESVRWGLPAFKILGASWGINKAIIAKCGLPEDAGLGEVGAAARAHGVKLYAATEGNHGRAVARMAKTFGIESVIYVQRYMISSTQDLIRGEGAEVIVVQGDYDFAVQEAAREAKLTSGILVQDTAFEGYEEIPNWIVDGYSTLLREIDEQLAPKSPTILVVPVGVGSLAEAVVIHSKSSNPPRTVLAVEPHDGACLRASLQTGKMTTIKTKYNIMPGMTCGTLSMTAWPVLKAGIDACVTVSDAKVHQAVLDLESLDILAGPCGGASLAALRHVVNSDPEAIRLTPDSVVVLISSEGPREYSPSMREVDIVRD